MILWGLFLGIFSGILCNFSKNNGWNPINRNLWSLSFVSFTSSIAIFLFSFLLYILDILKIEKIVNLLFGFKVMGMNSLFIYMTHYICKSWIPFTYSKFYGLNEFKSNDLRFFASFLSAFTFLLIALYLNNKKMYFVVYYFFFIC